MQLTSKVCVNSLMIRIMYGNRSRTSSMSCGMVWIKAHVYVCRRVRLTSIILIRFSARSIKDMELVNELSSGTVDLTFGSALDIFGGGGVTFEELVRWNSKG